MSDPQRPEDGPRDRIGEIIRHAEDDTRYVVEQVHEGQILLGELGNRLLDECPVEYGGECVDTDCDGRVGETERDPDTYSAHELYCYGCGLNWVEHGGVWEEKYADWPTSFSFEDGEGGASA